jgi:hypothetical protein
VIDEASTREKEVERAGTSASPRTCPPSRLLTDGLHGGEQLVSLARTGAVRVRAIGLTITAPVQREHLCERYELVHALQPVATPTPERTLSR